MSIPLRPVNGIKIILKREVYAIVGTAIEVLRALGHGIHEKPYEKALVVEFGLRNIPCQQQSRFNINYKEVKVGEYVPDLIVFGEIIVDTKVIDAISDHERGQMINYLRITGLPVGVILNFRYAKLQWERLVLTD
ncbi:MAG: GxxExxY protein [Verrucomicrobia bacterium]|nr:GxxExxY protein [Verrucomicrobiota bacterium]